MFGSLLFCFVGGAYIFDFREITPERDHILAIFAASLGAFFGYFFSGTVGVSIISPKTALGTASVKATGTAALFVLVLFWWVRSASPLARHSEFDREFQRTVQNLEKQIDRWGAVVGGLTNSGVNRLEQLSLVESQARAIRQTFDSLMAQKGITKREATRLGALKEAFEQKEKAGLAQSDMHLQGDSLPSASVSTNGDLATTTGEAAAVRPPPPGARPIPLVDYMRSNQPAVDFSALGFSRDGAQAIHVLPSSLFGFRTNINLISKVSDFSAYENPEFPGYHGPWTIGVVLVERLSSAQFYRPLLPDVRLRLVAELRELAIIAPLLTNITLLTCTGIVNCDQFVAEIVQACREAGFSVELGEVPEEPFMKWLSFGARPRTSVFRVVGGSYCLQPKIGGQINRAFYEAVGFKADSMLYGWSLPERTLRITIAGFPEFDDKGRPVFEVWSPGPPVR